MTTIPLLPLFRSLLTTPNGDRWFRPWSPDKMERLDAALATWFAAQSAGSIDNPRFVDSKAIIGRAVEDAWGAIARDRKALDALSDADRNALDSLPAPNLSNVSGRRRRVAAAPPGALRTQTLAFLDEIKPLEEVYAFLKAHTVKRVQRTEEERAAAEFRPPATSNKAVAQVRLVLEAAIDRVYQELVANRRDRNRKIIAAYLAAQAKELAAPPPSYPHGYSPVEHYSMPGAGYRRVTNPSAVAFLSKVLDADQPAPTSARRGLVYFATPETYKMSDAEALDEAKRIRDQFLFKNLVKLTPLLEAKGADVFESIQEIGTFDLARFEGAFRVKFTDGSHFRLNNAVVFVTNQYDTSFCRFPTTFHDVVLPDGQPMTSPSEERMHTVFAPTSQGTTDGEKGPPSKNSRSRRRR
jgi:hypothetical protein